MDEKTEDAISGVVYERKEEEREEATCTVSSKWKENDDAEEPDKEEGEMENKVAELGKEKTEELGKGRIREGI